MKGIGWVPEVILAVGIVVFVLFLAIGSLKPFANINWVQFFNFSFPGANQGEPEPVYGGSNGIQPSLNQKISTQYSYYTPSEVGCYLSHYIYDDMTKYGNDFNSRLKATGNSPPYCLGIINPVFNYGTVCIQGFGAGNIGSQGPENPRSFAAANCTICGNGIAMDEACLSADWHQMTVVETPFCGKWVSGTGEVIFGNNQCFLSTTIGWPTTDCGNNSVFCNPSIPGVSSSSWDLNRVVSWKVDDGNEFSDGTISYIESSKMYTFDCCFSGNYGDYIFYSESRYDAVTPEQKAGDPLDISKYSIRVIREPKNTVHQNNSFSWISNYFPVKSYPQTGVNPPPRWRQYPLRDNDLGFFYTPARTVLDWNFTLTSELSLDQVLSSLRDSSGSSLVLRDDVNYDCGSTLEECENLFGVYNFSGSFRDVQDLTNFPNYAEEPLTFPRPTLVTNIGPNTNFKPGVYRIVIRNWWNWFRGSESSYNHFVAFTIFADRVIIIYRVGDIPQGNECRIDSDCSGTKTCISHSSPPVDGIGSYKCVFGYCEFSETLCTITHPTCVETPTVHCTGI